MKIVFVQGSPRKNGNTRILAEEAIKSARAAGAEVDVIDVLDFENEYPGCTGCNSCQSLEGFGCVIGDDLANAVDTIPNYDVIVLASPLYWWSYPAQLKMFVDRMYSLTKVMVKTELKSAIAGKTVALLATSAGPLEDNLDMLEAQWKRPSVFLKWDFKSALFPKINPEPGSVKSDKELLKKAAEFGRELAGA